MPIGHVMLDLDGFELSAVEQEIIQHPQVGGVILFSRNYVSKKQLGHLTKAIRKLSPDCLIAVDQEGGRVQRFQQDFLPLPAFKTYGDLYEENPNAALEHAEKMAFHMASELLEVGIDLSFTPVLDLNRGNSEVIGDRSFHRNANIVVDLGNAFVEGMHSAGMPATGKHFPGHGAVSGDSHKTLPVDKRSFEQICREDMQPFAMLHKKLDGIMPAHILYENVDSQPTCFSNFWLQEVLRKNLAFEGIIFSDDLSMAGAEFIPDYVERAEKALSAGCDIVLVCNHRPQAIRILESLENYRHPASQQRLVNFREKRLSK